MKIRWLICLFAAMAIMIQPGQTVLVSCNAEKSNGTNCLINNISGSAFVFLRSSLILDTYTSVTFENCNLGTVPSKLFTTFNKLTKVDMSKSNIQTMDRTSMVGASKLLVFDLSGNNLEQLDGSIFSGASALMELFLSRNKISTINVQAFSGLKNLKILDLSYNLLKIIRDDIFWDLRAVKTIYLNNNAMSTLRVNFANSTQLAELDASHNELVDWSLTFPTGSKVSINLAYCKLKNTYSSAADKDVLIIDGNNIDYIKITGLASRVSANYNKIRFVEIDWTLDIDTLELSGNYITDVGNITKTKSLQKLDLSFNKLSSVNKETFSQLKELRFLNLQATGIALEDEMFSNQKYLVHLDISANDMSLLNLRDLNNLMNLKTLKVDGNKLNEILHYEDIKEILPSLSAISLSKNQFNCSYLSEMLKQFENDKISVLIDSRQIQALDTNIMGIDCVTASDDINESDTKKILNKMIMLRTNALDLENMFKAAFATIDGRFQENLNNVKEALKNSVDNTNSFNENLEKYFLDIKGLLNNSGTDEKFATIIQNFNSMLDVKQQFDAMNLEQKYTKIMEFLDLLQNKDFQMPAAIYDDMRNNFNYFMSSQGNMTEEILNWTRSSSDNYSEDSPDNDVLGQVKVLKSLMVLLLVGFILYCVFRILCIVFQQRINKKFFITRSRDSMGQELLG